MPLVPAKCTQCGASVEVDNEKEAAICTHCGTAFVVEKAINNYHVTNNVVNNIHADVVNVVEGNIEDYIRNAESAYEFEDYDKMSEMADKILNLDPQNLDGIFYKVSYLVKHFKREEETVTKVLNYLLPLAKQEFKISKTKRLAETVIKEIFLARYDVGDKTFNQKIYDKFVSICDLLEIDPLSLEALDLLDHAKYNSLLDLYLKDRYPNESDMTMKNVPKLSQDKDGYYVIQFTKNFIHYSTNSSYVGVNKTYYKKAINLTLDYNGTYVFLGTYNKQDGYKLASVNIGATKFLHNDSKKIAFVYQVLKKNGFDIKPQVKDWQYADKLNKILGL